MAKKRSAKAKSIRALGRLVGRAESTVRKWLARDDWPFGRTPPWNVESVKAWSEIHLKGDPAAAYRKKVKAAQAGTGEFAAMGPLTKARMQAAIERALYIRQKRLMEAGKLIDAVEAQRARLRQIHAVKGVLIALPRSMANSLAGLDREAIEMLLQKRMNEIFEEFAAGDDSDEN